MSDMIDILLVCLCRLILTMLDKYILLCSAFSFAMSAVTGISLDYYFGFDESLRSAQYIQDCNSRRTQETCQQQCGPDHACLLGKCFCASLRPPIKDGGKGNIPRLSNSRCNKLRTKLKVLDEFLEKTRSIDARPDLSSENDVSSEEFEANENNKYYMRLDEKALRPSLRHHIAHFCPNLDIARKCIRKCLERGKPAFCGKDHVCYCGHRYDSYHQDVPVNVSETYAAFQDLYEKYFGPRIAPESITTTTDKNSGLPDIGKNNGVQQTAGSGSEETESKATGSKETVSKEAGSKETGSKETESKATGSKEADSKEAGSKEAGSKETESKESTTTENAATESETTSSAPA